MIDRRAIGSFIATGGLLVLLATPVLAGITPCSLQATVDGGSATEVTVGEEVLIEGFDFFPGDVLVTYSADATLLSSVTVTADVTGAFTTTITPQAGEEGLWTVEATDSSKAQCTATTSFLVLGVPGRPHANAHSPHRRPFPRRPSCPTSRRRPRRHRRRRCSSAPRSWRCRQSCLRGDGRRDRSRQVHTRPDPRAIAAA